MDTRSRVSIWMDAGYRYALINLGSGVIPLYVVTEFPKCGGTWAAQMLSEILEVPLPRNELFLPRKSILHAHLCHSYLMKNVICIYRDGRDAMVSFYYHNFFESEKNSPLLVKYMRNQLQFNDYDDIRKNMPDFLRFMHVKLHNRSNPYRFTWGEYVDSWHGKNAIYAKYEDLLTTPVVTLRSVLEKLKVDGISDDFVTQIVNKYSFEQQSSRIRGTEDVRSFLRKGIAGDWKENFCYEAAFIFNQYYGRQLIDLGYEDSENWVAECE